VISFDHVHVDEVMNGEEGEEEEDRQHGTK
jgi:hypothetical protein